MPCKIVFLKAWKFSLEVLTIIFDAMAEGVNRLFLYDDGLIDPELRDRLANPEDSKRYMDGIRALRNGAESVRIEFTDGKIIEIY